MNYQIILETDELLVINKPTACHTSGEDSLESILLADNLLNKKIQDNGLVQRLDFETSGCLTIAKTEDSYQSLKDIIKEHLWQKEYLAQRFTSSAPFFALWIRLLWRTRRRGCPNCLRGAGQCSYQ